MLSVNVECVSPFPSLPNPIFLTSLQFYLDNLDDELNIMALRMLVKDLLILFQACNEGVINVLGERVHQYAVARNECSVRTLF